MSKHRMGRSVSGEANVPYYAGSREQEAAKFLRLSAARFLAGRANAKDLDEAVGAWLTARAATSDVPTEQQAVTCKSCGGNGYGDFYTACRACDGSGHTTSALTATDAPTRGVG